MTHLQRAVAFVNTHPDAVRLRVGSDVWVEIMCALQEEAKRKERGLMATQTPAPALLFMGRPLELHGDLPADAIL